MADKEHKTIGQYYTGIVSCLSWFTVGTALAFTSPTLPKMKQDKDLNITDTISPWIGSAMVLGAICGCVLGGKVAHMVGYKLSLVIILAPLFVIGYVVILTSYSAAQIIIGRVIVGIACGFTCVALPIYIGEIADPRIRGKVGTLQQLMITIGILFVNVVGLQLSWSITALTCIVCPVLLAIFILPCPESPNWLLWKGKDEKANKSLNFFHGKKCDHASEIAEMKAYIAERKQLKGTFGQLFTSWTKYPLILALGLMFFQQAGGINSIIFYSATIFESATNSSDQATISTITVCLVQVVATFIACMTIDKFGRKPLLIISCLLEGISLILLGVFFFFKQTLIDKNLGFLSLICVVVYIAAFSLGFGPVPWMIIGELFPQNLKSKAVTLASLMNWIMAFIISWTFEPLSKVIEEKGVFLMFGIINVICLFFCIFLVLETKGKQFSEIEKMYQEKHDMKYKSKGNSEVKK